jgi:hypothetical protein
MAVTYEGKNGGADAWSPGSFIDIFGADGYNWFPVRDWADWESFETVFTSVHDYAVSKGKPMAAMEWGCLEQDSCGNTSGDPAAKRDWFYAAQATIQSWPEVTAVSYSNTSHVVNGHTADWRFTSSRRSLRAFKAVGHDAHFN